MGPGPVNLDSLSHALLDRAAKSEVRKNQEYLQLSSTAQNRGKVATSRIPGTCSGVHISHGIWLLKLLAALLNYQIQLALVNWLNSICCIVACY